MSEKNIISPQVWEKNSYTNKITHTPLFTVSRKVKTWVEKISGRLISREKNSCKEIPGEKNSYTEETGAYNSRKNILHLCKSGEMFFHHRFGKKNSYTNKSPIHPSKVKWSANQNLKVCTNFSNAFDLVQTPRFTTQTRSHFVLPFIFKFGSPSEV